MRLGWGKALTQVGVALVVGLSLALAGCESSDAKCVRLRSAATDAWGRYAQALQTELDATQVAHDAAKKKLEGEVHQRHEAEARKQADHLHGAETKTSTAWWRTFLATTQAQCSKDPECLDLKVQVSEAEKKVADLGPRIALVRAAEVAVKSKPDAAKRAADAVPSDAEDAAEHETAEPARVASAEAIAACGDAAP
jgi:hypothetical protein